MFFIERQSCAANEFTCPSGECIASNSRCNLVKDCNEGNDEENCGQCSLPKCKGPLYNETTTTIISDKIDLKEKNKATSNTNLSSVP